MVQEAGVNVDFCHVAFRQGIVHEPDIPKAGIAAFNLILRHRNFTGSAIGGIPVTQEMLDFCGKNNITADVEVIPIQKINEAYERILADLGKEDKPQSP